MREPVTTTSCNGSSGLASWASAGAAIEVAIRSESKPIEFFMRLPSWLFDRRPPPSGDLPAYVRLGCLKGKPAVVLCATSKGGMRRVEGHSVGSGQRTIAACPLIARPRTLLHGPLKGEFRGNPMRGAWALHALFAGCAGIVLPSAVHAEGGRSAACCANGICRPTDSCGSARASSGDAPPLGGYRGDAALLVAAALPDRDWARVRSAVVIVVSPLATIAVALNSAIHARHFSAGMAPQ